MSLPDIDFAYWYGSNEIYSRNQLSQSIRKGLTYAQGFGLIDDVIEGLAGGRITNGGLIEKIQDATQCGEVTIAPRSALLRAFDLIQGWGGPSGRFPFVQPPGRSSRKASDDWIEHYRLGIASVSSDDPESALTSFQNIYGVGPAFATKHMYFWGQRYGRFMPILNSRDLELLFPIKSSRPVGYKKYRNTLKDKAQSSHIAPSIVEPALTAFIRAYFKPPPVSKKGVVPRWTRKDDAKTYKQPDKQQADAVWDAYIRS